MMYKIKFFFICFLFSFFSKYCYSYNSDYFFSPIIVEDINFVGLKRVSSDAIIFQLPIIPGDILSERSASNMLKKLYSLNCFNKIKIEVNEKKVLIRFSERPIISKIIVKGSKKHRDVINNIKSSFVFVGSFYNVKNLYIAKEKVYKYYSVDLSHFGVEVNVYVAKHKFKINILFDINEGTKIFVKNIKIIGNNLFFNDLFFKYNFFSNKLFSFFSDRFYTNDKLNVVTEKLKIFYLNLGYADIEIYSNKLLIDYNKKCVDIIFKINKGKRYYLRNIYLCGKIMIPKYKLLFFISNFINSGDNFSINNIYKLSYILKEKFNNMGYLDSVIEYYCNFDKNKNFFDLIYYIAPGEKILTRYVNFLGDNKTKDYILRYCLYNNENNYISTDDIFLTKNNLLKNNLIYDIRSNVKRSSYNPRRTDVIYNINEKKKTTFTLNIGYNTSNKFVFTATAAVVNFYGSGKNLNFNLERTNLAHNYSFNYLDPNFITNNNKFFYNVGMGYNIKINNNIISKVKKTNEYSTNISGCSVFWNISYYKNYQINLEVGYEKIKLNVDLYSIKTSNIVSLCYLQNINITGNCFYEYYFNFFLKYNSLDRASFATRGISYNINFKTTLPHSSINYYQLNLNFNYYKTFLKKYVFNLLGHIKYGGVYNYFYSYPFFKNYSFTGVNIVRGFEDKSLGPKISKGDKRLSLGGNFSLLFKFSFFMSQFYGISSVRPGIFFDLGQIYDTINYKAYNIEKIINPSFIKYSIGFTFIWATPFGMPLEISIAKPFNIESSDKLKMVHCSLGTTL